MHFCYRLIGATPRPQKLEEMEDPKVLAYNALVDKHVDAIKQIILNQSNTLSAERDCVQIDEFSLAAADHKDLNPFEHHKTSEEICNEFAINVLNKLRKDRDVLKKLTQDVELHIRISPPEVNDNYAKCVIELRKKRKKMCTII